MYLQCMLTDVIYTLQTKQICCRLSIKAADSCGSNSLDLDKPHALEKGLKQISNIAIYVYIKNGKKVPLFNFCVTLVNRFYQNCSQLICKI